MLRLEGLNHRPSGGIATSGTTHHLGQHIKSGFPCPVTAGIQAQVCIQHPHQCHTRQVQPFGNHLGSKQNRNIVLLEVLQNFLMGIYRTDCVCVHPQSFQIRKQGRKLLLHLLGAGANGFQRTAAGRAPLRRRLGKAAVMAHEPMVGAVVGQLYIAAGAFRGFPAIHAHQRPAVSPAIQKQYRLLSGIPGLQDCLPQGDTQRRIVAKLQFLPQIHNVHFRQGLAVEAFPQGIQAVCAGFCPVHTLHGGSGGAKQHQRSFLRSPPDGDFLRGVPGGAFGFIGMLLLLIQNDNAGGAGGKDCTAGADDNLCIAAFHPLPLVVAFRSGQAAVEHRCPVAKMRRQNPQKLRGQGDFRHQQHGAFPSGNTRLNQTDIHRGFARTGNAVEQRHTGLRLLHLVLQSFKAGLLLRVQHQRSIQPGRAYLPAAQYRTLRQGQKAQPFQPVYRCRGSACKIAQVLHRHTAHAAQKLQHLFLHGSRFGAAGSKRHGFLRRNRKGSDFLGFIVGFPQIVRLCRHPFFPGQVGQNFGKGVLLRNEITQSIGFRLTA